MSLSPKEITGIEELVASGHLIQVSIEQNGERIVIGGSTPAETLAQSESLTAVSAPLAGTVTFDASAIGLEVAEGDAIARLRVLDAETPVVAPVAGRIAAVLATDGDLVGYGAELLLIATEADA